MSQLPDYIYIPESSKHSTLDFVTAYLDFEEAENNGYEKESLQEYIPSYRHEEGVRDAKKELIEKAVEYAEARYDLDYCGNVRDVLNYLKSLTEK